MTIAHTDAFTGATCVLSDLRCAELSILHDGLRECVRRYSRLPQILVVDGGQEFGSTYFETLLAQVRMYQKNQAGCAGTIWGRLRERCSEPPTPSSSTICGATPRSLAMFGRSPSPWIRKAWRHGRWRNCINDLSQYLYESPDTFDPSCARPESTGGFLNWLGPNWQSASSTGPLR